MLVWAIVVQGAIGYTQYFAGVPAGLVLAARDRLGGGVGSRGAASRFATRRPVAQAEGTDAAASEPSLAATS